MYLNTYWADFIKINNINIHIHIWLLLLLIYLFYYYSKLKFLYTINPKKTNFSLYFFIYAIFLYIQNYFHKSITLKKL